MNLRDSPNFTKKVWRPLTQGSPSVISVVTNNRAKICHKEEYSLKIGDVCMPDKRTIFSNGSDCSVVASPSPSSSIKTEKCREYYGASKCAFQFTINGRDVGECVDVSHLQNTSEFPQRYLKTVKIVKNERKLARKVYLRWSKYCVSQNENEYESSNSFRDDGNKKPFTEGIDGREAITSLRLRRQFLAKKYWYRWRSFVKTNKAVSGNSSTRGSYRGRRTTARREDDGAKRLIEAQKRKIEQQANLINELKLIQSKLEEDKFVSETDRMLQECAVAYEKTTRDKAQYLRTYSIPTDRKYDGWHRFVTRMEVRASERKKRWDDIKERKRKLEEDRMQKLKAEEEKRKQIEEEAKKQKIMEMRREKRRLEELRKKQQEERIHMSKLNEMAKTYNDTRLLRSCLSAFVHFVRQEKLKSKEAEYHYNRTVLTQLFSKWKLLWKLEEKKRMDRADEFYEFSIMKRAFFCLKKVHREYVHNIQVASDFYEFCLQKNCLYGWQLYSLKCKYEYEKKENSADDYYKLNLLQNSFERWKQLPRVLFLEREKEQRIRLWCYKVQELLPDFRPSFQCC